MTDLHLRYRSLGRIVYARANRPVWRRWPRLYRWGICSGRRDLHWQPRWPE